MAIKKAASPKGKEEIMAEPTEAQIPKTLVDFNARIVEMLKKLDTNDFLLVLSHPSRLARIAADQQQQQQQQQQGHRSL